MTARLCTPSFHPHPLSTHFKSAHRAVADVRIGRGNHEAFGHGLVAIRGWYPIEILHFPVRSLEHCLRKYVTQFVALERNAEKGIPGHMADAYRAYRAGALQDFYAPLVVDDVELDEAVRRGDLAIDTRLRERLRALGFGGQAPATDRQPVVPSVLDDAAFAAEYSPLRDSDVGLVHASRVEELERRLGALR